MTEVISLEVTPTFNGGADSLFPRYRLSSIRLFIEVEVLRLEETFDLLHPLPFGMLLVTIFVKLGLFLTD